MAPRYQLSILALVLGGGIAEESVCGLDKCVADEATLLQGKMNSRSGKRQLEPLDDVEKEMAEVEKEMEESAQEMEEVAQEIEEAEKEMEDASIEMQLFQAESQPASPGSWVLPTNWNIQASSSWDGNYEAANVVVEGGRPWHSGRRNAFPEDLTFDAGEVITLDGFRTAQPLHHWRGSAMRAFTFLKSNDGQTFTEVLQSEGRNLASGETQDIEFPAVSARYWRLHMQSNHGYHRLLTVQYIKFRLGAIAMDDRLTAYWEAGNCGPHGNDYNARTWCGGVGSDTNGIDPHEHCQEEVQTDICESGVAELVDIQGSGRFTSVTIDGCAYAYYAQYRCAEPVPCSWALPTNWNIQASSSWDGNYEAANVVAEGGRPWHSGRRNAFPEDLTFDAGEVVTLDGFRTAQPPNHWRGSAMRAFTFLKSNDGETFTEVLQGEGRNLASGETQDIEFPAVSARYWRLHMQSNHGYHRLLTVQYINFRLCPVVEEPEEPDAIGVKGNDGNGIQAVHGGPDGATRIQFIDLGAGAFEAAGEIRSIRYHVSRANQAGQKFQIYRPVSGNTYHLVAETEALASTQAGSIVTQTLQTPLQFQAGDYIGWVHTGHGTFPFRNSGGSVRWRYGIQGVGSNIDFNGAGPRVYAYEVSYTEPANEPKPGADEYVGCFVDDHARDLGRMVGATQNAATNTFELCRAACGDSRYMSLQYGGECFCADSYGNGDQYVQVEDSECNRVVEPCSSNSHNCGGTWRQAIYEINEPSLHNFGQAGGGNACPDGRDVSEEDCLEAAQSLLARGQAQGRAHLVAGSWGWVPPGCSVQTHRTHGHNGDFAAHFNRGAGNNDGGYTKVCATSCQHLHNQDVVAGTFEHYGRDHGGSASDEACSASCTADPECTAWVRQPSSGRCWISRQAVVTFEADRDRTTGLRCN